MSATQNQYNIGLDKTPANFVPLSPLSFLERTAAVYPDHVSTVYEGRVFTWARDLRALPAFRVVSGRAAASAAAIRWRRCCRTSPR